MKRFWMVFWFLFLVLHLLTLFLGHLRDRNPRAMVSPMDAELIELAQLTNEEWSKLGFAEPSSGLPSQVLSPEDEILHCQALILQLRKVEQRLASDGADVRIAEDLQAWVARHLEDKDATPASPYLSGLLNWIKPFLANETSCALQRLLLHPDQRSSFPGLVFELAGEPTDMGRSLLPAGYGIPRWHLREMDLCRVDSGSQWWIRGSCSFDAEPIP